MCITFDGGNTRLNFAEAALLIQGSACIYSKKVHFKLSTNKTSVISSSSAWTSVCLFQVELLHSLVYQTLEYINDKNKKWDIRQVWLNDCISDKQLKAMMFFSLFLSDGANRRQRLRRTVRTEQQATMMSTMLLWSEINTDFSLDMSSSGQNV